MGGVAHAQTPPPTDQNVELPPLVVEGAKQKKKSQQVNKAKSKPSAVATPTAPVPEKPDPPASDYEAATGPVNGFAATSSATATKTGTPIIETPQAISVVGREEMDARGATTMQQALSYTPGVQSFASPRSLFLDEFQVRGFDTSTGNLGQLRDGLKLQPSVYDGGQEAYGLERIEVLKGASSILYGQLNPGGLINSISKRPSFTQQGEVNVTGGSFDNKQISADITGPAGKEWAYRLTALGRESDTWVDYIDNDRLYIAPSLTWKPSDVTTLTLLSYYQETRTKLSAPMNFVGTVIDAPGIGKVPRDRFIGEPSFDRFDINSGALGYLFEHKFSPDVTFRSGARYYESKGDWDYLTFRGFTVGPDGPAIRRGFSSREEHSQNWTTDNSLEVKFGSGSVRHTVIAGVDYGYSIYNTHRLRDNNIAAGGTLDLDDPEYGFEPVTSVADSGFKRKLSQVGIYVQDQVHLFDQFVLVAGGRQDWAETDTLDYRGGPFSQSDSAFSGRLGLVYLGPWGFAPYVSYSESFSPVLAVGYGVAEAKPTTGAGYEAGIRWESPDKKTLITAAAFTIDQENVVTFTSPPDFDFRQTGLVRSEGFELEAKTQSGPWSATAAYAYTDARIERDEIAAIIGQSNPGVPLHSFSVWADYDFTGLGLRGFTFGAGVRYVGSTNLIDYTNNTPYAYDVPSYVLVDAAASLDLGQVNRDWRGYHMQVVANNLFDELTISCSSPIQGCDYGQPLTVTGTLSYRW
jgi:iron complex outermembrane receptor protein